MSIKELNDMPLVTVEQVLRFKKAALAEIQELRQAIKETLEENAHLADGDVCTLIKLKQAIGRI